MWRQALFVEFSKFEQFRNAVEIVNVPCDSLDEAGDLWDEWRQREYVQSVNAFN